MTNPNFPSLEEAIARRKENVAKREALDAEDNVLAKIIEAHSDWEKLKSGKGTAIDAPSVNRPPIFMDASAPQFRKKKKTKRDLIIESLEQPRQVWQTAREILKYIQSQSDNTVEMGSISPTLTGLKKSGAIIRNDLLVALALRVEKEELPRQNENGPPEGGPEAGDFAESPN
jgi:hypothetical protein